jgi:hypothetical protein
MKTIFETLQNFNNDQVEKKKRTSQRAELIGEVYDIYTSPTQRLFRKKQNWKRYIAWIKKNRTPHTKENQEKFKKVKSKDGGFIKEHNIKTFCFFLSHLKEKDLYYALSVGRDMENRNENFGAWIMSLNK